VRRMKRAVEDAATAMTEGREEDARRALIEARRVASETGVELPALPNEVQELWVQVTTAAPRTRSAGTTRTTRMDDRSRELLLEGASLAAQRLHDLMSDDALWGSEGSLRVEVQGNLIEKALRLGYGGMPAGAQVVTPPSDPEGEERQAGDVLRMMIRSKQEAKGDG